MKRGHIDIYIHIATTRKNRPKGRFFEKEEKPKDGIKVVTVEEKEKKEDTVTVSKEHMKEMQARFDQRLNENIELKKRVTEWSNQMEAMSHRVKQAENSKKSWPKS